MPVSLETPPHNLPAQLTTLIGRQREIEALTRLLVEDGARFLTLTGPGGSGKTRLSIEAAAQVVGANPDGVFFVNLAPVTEWRLIPSTIAQILGVRESGQVVIMNALQEFLRSRKLLLLLDNCEQVIDGAPLVADLLLACPQLQVMVTSRAALPDRSQPLGVDDLQRYAAASLFLERARAVNPGLLVTEEAVRDIAEACARLDELPPAIELAATRMKLLTPAAILARQDRRFSLLSDGARDLPERQRTLRGAIAWSYDLLDVAEQALFRRLAVCAGEAPSEFRSPTPDTLDLLASLVDKNLLRQAEASDIEPRFEFLETIREFALEALGASGELEEARRRHALFFLSLAEEADTHLAEQGNETWLRRLDREHDNLRTALRWAIERGMAHEGLRLAGALWQFWQHRGHLGEGRQWLDAALRLGPAPACSPPTNTTTAPRAPATSRAWRFTGRWAISGTLPSA